MSHPAPSESALLAARRCDRLVWRLLRREQGTVDEVPDFDELDELEGLLASTEPDLVDLREVDPSGHPQAAFRALESGRAVRDARFPFGDVSVRIPLLRLRDRRVEVVAVAPSSHPRETDLDRLALAVEAFLASGWPDAVPRLFCIEKSYVRGEGIDCGRLFRSVDFFDGLRARRLRLPALLEKTVAIRSLADAPAPVSGPWCHHPVPCRFEADCFGPRPEPDPIYGLFRGRKLAEELHSRGVRRLEDVPEDAPLTEIQTIQVAAARAGREIFDATALRSFLGRLRFPIHFIDFEAFQTLLPRFPGMSPYQVVPFQYSLHVLESADAEPVPLSFLARRGVDPRPGFLRSLKSHLAPEGSLVAFNAGFESGRLQDLARNDPSFREWVEELLPRFVDIWEPFRNFHWYHPAQAGKTGLKTILPLLSRFRHSDLAVADGRSASLLFLHGHFRERPESEIATLREDLLAYCAMDTFALVEIYRALRAATLRTSA